jgi:60 kDa SS-A/Ro ribonucleoprotein
LYTAAQDLKLCAAVLYLEKSWYKKKGGIVMSEFFAVLKNNLKGKVFNRAGGVGYTITDAELLRRFLLLGTDQNTYYATAKELSHDALLRLLPFIKNNVQEVVVEAVDVSQRRLAPRNIHAVHALAIATHYAKTDDDRAFVLEAIPLVIRHGGELLQYVAMLEVLGSWGRFKRRAVTTWLNTKKPVDLAYTVLKYAQRQGWSMRDVLRVAHPRPVDETVSMIYRWVITPPNVDDLHRAHVANDVVGLWVAAARLKGAKTEQEVVDVLRAYPVSHEFVPNTWYASRAVWQALVPNMPILALLRALPTLTRAGVRDTETLTIIRTTFQNHADRIHPIRWLYATEVYKSGRGTRSSWEPWDALVELLDSCTRASFERYRHVVPGRVLVAIDASGSMGRYLLGNARVFDLALAMAYTLAPQGASQGDVILFDTEAPCVLDGGGDYQTFMQRGRELFLKYGGGTDLSLPLQYAAERAYDAVVIFTDNETWAGVHGKDVGAYIVNHFRPKCPRTKVILCAMTATTYSAAPSDTHVLNVCGFDLSVPHIITSFLGAPLMDSSDE